MTNKAILHVIKVHFSSELTHAYLSHKYTVKRVHVPYVA